MKPSIFLILFLMSQILSYPQTISKSGGICFRTDDNKSIEKYLEYAEIFKQYEVKFTFALNLGRDELNSADYVNGIKKLQADGHEMMDHTPWHRTNYFYTKLGTDYYLDHPGVHEISGTKIKLKHQNINLDDATRSGIVSINGNKVTSSEIIFSNFAVTDCYLYFESLQQLVFIEKWVSENEVEITDIWRNSISLGFHQSIKFHNFSTKHVHLTIDAIKALAEESIRLSDFHKLPTRPHSWIQPGGDFPKLYSNELKQALSVLGFKSAGVFSDPSLKVFNEYNPDADKQFGMSWGDFRDDASSLTECKNYIADKVAKHHLAIGHNHFTELLGGWDGFLERTDNLIQWCIEEDIPIKTYAEWADILYTKTTDPFENIFPNLDIDKDDNNVPDGFSKRSWTYDGIWMTNDGVPESNNFSYSIDRVGGICHIDDLAGLEKSENHFEIWTKGASGNYIEVDFQIGSEHSVYKFPAENTEWTKYDLSQSINSNTSLYIPENISVIDVTIRCSNHSSGNVAISGMSLSKKAINLELKVFLEGAYHEDGKMQTSINSILPNNQPFYTEPWNYSGNETIIGELNSSIVDWVLVTLKNDANSQSYILRRAALLKNDGSIVDMCGNSPLRINADHGNYYILLQHRNHIPIISSVPIQFE